MRLIVGLKRLYRQFLIIAIADRYLNFSGADGYIKKDSLQTLTFSPIFSPPDRRRNGTIIAPGLHRAH